MNPITNKYDPKPIAITNATTIPKAYNRLTDSLRIHSAIKFQVNLLTVNLANDVLLRHLPVIVIVAKYVELGAVYRVLLFVLRNLIQTIAFLIILVATLLIRYQVVKRVVTLIHQYMSVVVKAVKVRTVQVNVTEAVVIVVLFVTLYILFEVIRVLLLLAASDHTTVVISILSFITQVLAVAVKAEDVFTVTVTRPRGTHFTVVTELEHVLLVIAWCH